jgi:hypothetical protein
MAIRNNTRGPLFEWMSSNAKSLEQRQMGKNGYIGKENLKIYRWETRVLVDAMKLLLELLVEAMIEVESAWKVLLKGQ